MLFEIKNNITLDELENLIYTISEVPEKIRLNSSSTQYQLIVSSKTVDERILRKAKIQETLREKLTERKKMNQAILKAYQTN